MFDRVQSIVLRALRVPPQPTPPLGAPGSIRIFRAGQNFYRLRLAEWSLAQLGAAIGIAFSVVFLVAVQREIERTRPTQEIAPATNAARPAPDDVVVPSQTLHQRHPAVDKAARPFHEAVAFASSLPPWVLLVAEILKIGGILVYLGQLPFSYVAVRLEYEQHWYIVTDRSLRIRHGLVSILESTMSFANIQQVVVHQGPLQRLLGLADVRVQSAGGGDKPDNHKKHEESLHIGVFRGVSNADEIRDLVLERLRLFRETGLGDTDEPRHPPPPASTTPAEVIAAAGEVLTEVRALKNALSSAS